MWAVIRRGRGPLVAFCDALGLTVEADNQEELRSVIAEAQHVLMLDLLEDGELPRFLSDRGWTPSVPLPSKAPKMGVRFDVPFTVAPAHGHA